MKNVFAADFLRIDFFRACVPPPLMHSLSRLEKRKPLPVNQISKSKRTDGNQRKNTEGSAYVFVFYGQPVIFYYLIEEFQGANQRLKNILRTVREDISADCHTTEA